MGKNNGNLIILGLLAVGGIALYATQKCGILYPLFKSQCNASEAKAQGVPVTSITDDYVKNYKQFRNN